MSGKSLRRSQGFRIAFAFFIGFVPVIAGCEPARAPSQPTISLRMRGGPSDATVIVDDEPLGSLEFVAAHGVALPPGIHHVTVRAPGYFPWDHEFDAKPGSALIALEVALTRVPD